jgi:hypothetical protein
MQLLAFAAQLATAQHTEQLQVALQLQLVVQHKRISLPLSTALRH